jgi:archaellum biogenesis ATPase FlaH
MGEERGILNLEDFQCRNELLTYFLLSEFDFTQRAELYSEIKNSKLFPEYDLLAQAGIFLSPEVVKTQTSFPHAFKTFEAITYNEVLGALVAEREYRLKKRLVDDLYRVPANLAQANIDEIKANYQRVLDRYKSSINYNSEWDISGTYEKEILTPFRAMSTGVSEIDKESYGIRTGIMSTLIGFASAGKSTVSLNIAYKAISGKFNVLLLTTELTKADVLYQLISCHSRNAGIGGKEPLPYKKIVMKQLTDIERQYMKELEVTLKNPEKYGKFMIADTDDLKDYSLSSLRNFCEQLPVYPDLIIVDYFQRLPFAARSKEDLTFKQGEAVKAFTSLAIGSDRFRPTAVLLAAQTNRSGWKETKDSKGGGMYDLTAIFEISQLEKDAGFVMAVKKTDDLTAKGCIELQVLKCRGGKDRYKVEVPIEWKYYTVGDKIEVATVDNSFDPLSFVQ